MTQYKLVVWTDKLDDMPLMVAVTEPVTTLDEDEIAIAKDYLVLAFEFIADQNVYVEVEAV